MRFVRIGHVAVIDQHWHAQHDAWRPGLLRLTASRYSFDRLTQHVLEQIDADCAQGARLLFPQQVAAAADVHILAGDVEADTGIGQGCDPSGVEKPSAVSDSSWPDSTVSHA